MPCRRDSQSFSLSIHSRRYGVQFSSFTPSASQRARKPITSRLTRLTSFRSRTMSRESVWSLKSLLSSTIAWVSIRPLRMNTVNLPRVAVSILKVIDQATSQSRLGCTAFLSSEQRSRVVQPSAQLDFIENTARKENWSDRILGSARFLGVERGGLADGVFLYVELFDFQIQRRPRNSEFGSRSIWPRNFSVAFRKSRFDEFFLKALEILCERAGRLWARCVVALKPSRPACGG